jgi:hypothetical protein
MISIIEALSHAFFNILTQTDKNLGVHHQDIMLKRSWSAVLDSTHLFVVYASRKALDENERTTLIH